MPSHYFRVRIWQISIYLFINLLIVCCTHKENDEPPIPSIKSKDEILALIKSREKQVDKDLQKNPNSAPLHSLKGDLLKGERKYDEAEKEFLRAIELDKGYAFAYRSFALMKQEMNQYEESIKYMEKFIELDPKNPFPHFELALNYIKLQKFELSLKECDIAKNLSKDMDYKCYKTESYRECSSEPSVKLEMQNRCEEVIKSLQNKTQ